MVEKLRIFSNMITIIHDACTHVYRGRAYYIETPCYAVYASIVV